MDSDQFEILIELMEAKCRRIVAERFGELQGEYFDEKAIEEKAREALVRWILR